MYYNRDGRKVVKVKEFSRGETKYKTTEQHLKDYGDLDSRCVWVYLNTIQKDLPKRDDEAFLEKEKEKEIWYRLKKNKEDREKQLNMLKEEKEKLKQEAIEEKLGFVNKFMDRFFN